MQAIGGQRPCENAYLECNSRRSASAWGETERRQKVRGLHRCPNQASSAIAPSHSIGGMPTLASFFAFEAAITQSESCSTESVDSIRRTIPAGAFLNFDWRMLSNIV